MKRLRTIATVIALCGFLLAAYTLPRIQFENDILALFPTTERQPDIAQARDHIKARIDHRVVFLLGGADQASIKAALPDFLQQLRNCPCFRMVNAVPDRSAWLGLHGLYAQHTSALLSEEVRTQLQAGGAEALVQSALQQIFTDPGTALAQRLERDPLGTLADFVGRSSRAPEGFRLDEEGHIWIEQGGRHYLLVQAELAGSPYAIPLQVQAEQAIRAARTDFERVSGGELLHSGALFYAQAGTHQAQGEISTVGLGSMAGIMVLLLVVFRAPALLLLAVLPIGVGVLFGLVACHWLFGRIHIVALVFGASLVGVAIDYALHFFTLRQTSGKHWEPESGLKELLPALTLGLLSSAAAYLSFALAGFPGLTQVAVFSAVGLTTAYGVVVGFFPSLLGRPARSPAPARLLRLAALYDTGFDLCRRHMRILPLALTALVIGGGLAQLEIDDDLRRMQTPDPAVVAMDQRVRAIVGQQPAFQYLVVRAADDEALLQALEALEPKLQTLQQQGVLDQFQSLSRWLPSAATQAANRQIWQTHLMDSGLMAELFAQIGVRQDVVQKLLRHHSEPSPQYLTLQHLEAHLRQLPDAPVWYQVEDRSYGVILLQGLRDSDAVKALAVAHPEVFWVDPVNQIQQLLRDYRVSASLLLAAAYLLIAAALSWRYGWRVSLVIVAPPFLATLLTLSLLGWAGKPLSVFNLMALALVLGIGIDAALFMRESHGRQQQTLVAISLTSLTTVLSFGLLALSATSAIQSFGLTVLLGITGCLLLAPLALPRSLKPDSTTHNPEVDTHVA